MRSAHPDEVLGGGLQADGSVGSLGIPDERAARLAVLAPIVGAMAGVAMSVPLWLILAWLVRASAQALAG